MKEFSFSDMLKSYYEHDKVIHYCDRFPRASKKRRIQKKWRKRFGKSRMMHIEEEFQRPSKVWEMIASKPAWSGGTISIPMMTEASHQATLRGHTTEAFWVDEDE